MSRQFVAASSQRIDFDSALGDWEFTQPWTVAAYIRTSSNASGQIVGKQEGSGNFRGWDVQTHAGTTSPKFQASVGSTGSLEANVRTVAEFSVNTFRRLVVTYDGSGVAAGFHIWVDGVDQALTTIDDTLASNTIKNAVAAQVGCRGGTAAAAFFGNFIARRLQIHNVAWTATEVANDLAGTFISRGLQCWQEFGPLNDGATVVADWSGNGHAGMVTGATHSTTDPSGIVAQLPAVGTSGPDTLSGPLTRNASNPILQNLGWVGGANNGQADQIGPGVIIKRGAGDYVGYFENVTGAKSLDVGDQTGAFDFDAPTTTGTSADGTAWTIADQDVPASAFFNCNTLGGGAPFKAAVRGETSIGALLLDPDDNVYKAWFHGGNNTGPRHIYLATCPAASDPTVQGNWTVQNSGNPVLSPGAAGAWDELLVADARVVRVDASLMHLLYVGYNASSAARLGHATSTDRGLTWTKDAANPVLSSGAAAWEAGDVYPAGFVYDAPTASFLCWYGGAKTLAAATAEGIGFAHSADASTWTRGAFNPVLGKKDATSGTNNVENVIGSTVSAYLDDSTYRIWYRADNGVSGATGFRGRNEATIDQIVLPAPATLTPSPATATWTALAAAVALGAVTVTPAPASASWATPDPAVTVGAVAAAPAAASGAWNVPTPAVSAGPITATPSAASDTWTVPTPAVAVGGVTATPSPAIATWVANTPSTTGGGAITPAPAITTWVANSPAVALGAIVATPAAPSATWTARAPAIALGGVTVAPAPAVSRWIAVGSAPPPPPVRSRTFFLVRDTATFVQLTSD